MKHVVIGTAGHVDHGKTTLIKALTHIETDRLKEEQSRGISIEIGFAYFDLPSGRRAGIIDVPGHERFIKNMLAGIGGVDLALLIIAADEGVMPQTEEHLNILSLLQIKQGLVVLTKKDLVETEWLELVHEEVRERLQGTFLAEAKIIAVSSTSGEGLSELTAEIDRLTETAESRDDKAPARLPIDRVFSVAGFGTVVTGTLVTGTLKVGERLEILPRGLEARVRNLQVHGSKQQEAYAGQRTAVNLAGIDQEQLSRGDVLAVSGTLNATLMLDARVQLLKSAPHPMEHRTRVRFYSGAAEVMARLVPLEQESLEPGESGLVQLRLEEPVAAAPGDIFILRSYSPMTTIAGGRIIDANPRKKTRFRFEQVAELKRREQGDPLEQAEQILQVMSPQLPERSEVLRGMQHLADPEELLEELLLEDLAVLLQADQKETILAAHWLKELAEQARQLFERFHQANPLKLGMPREELRSRVLKQANSRLFASLLLLWENEGIVRQNGQLVALADFQIRLNPAQQALLSEIEKLYLDNPYGPPSFPELSERMTTTKNWQPLFELLLAEGRLVRLNEEILLARGALEEAEDKLYAFFEQNTEMALADFRDLLATSRKYALPILEYFDNQKITQRKGEKRELRKKR